MSGRPLSSLPAQREDDTPLAPDTSRMYSTALPLGALAGCRTECPFHRDVPRAVRPRCSLAPRCSLKVIRVPERRRAGSLLVAPVLLASPPAWAEGLIPEGATTGDVAVQLGLSISFALLLLLTGGVGALDSCSAASPASDSLDSSLCVCASALAENGVAHREGCAGCVSLSHRLCERARGQEGDGTSCGARVEEAAEG